MHLPGGQQALDRHPAEKAMAPEERAPSVARLLKNASLVAGRMRVSSARRCLVWLPEGVRYRSHQDVELSRGAARVRSLGAGGCSVSTTD